MAASAPGLGELLGEWRLDPAPIVAALAAGGGYLGAVARARRWPRERTAAFLAGLALLVLALQSGIDAHATESLRVHMLQHLLLTNVAAALLVSGAPLTLALRALRAPWRPPLTRILRGRVVAGLTRPAVAWSAFTVVLAGTHLPAVYDLALRRPELHELEHAAYLWASLLFWTPLLAAEPLPRRLGSVGAIAYLLVAMMPMTVVGVWLLSAGGVVYPHYASTAPALGLSPLADQHAGGAVMWLGGTLSLVIALLAVAWSALAGEERRERAREAYADRALAAGGRR